MDESNRGDQEAQEDQEVRLPDEAIEDLDVEETENENVLGGGKPLQDWIK